MCNCYISLEFIQDFNRDDTHIKARLQINGVDSIGDWTNIPVGDLETIPGNDDRDEISWITQNVTFHDRSLLTVNVDVSKESGTGAEVVEDRFALAVSLFQKPPPGAQGSAIIKRVLSGSEAFTGTSLDVTIDAVDLEKSFLVFSQSVDSPNPGEFQVKGNLTDSTTVRFERTTAGSIVFVEWYVAEFESGVFVQRDDNDHLLLLIQENSK